MRRPLLIAVALVLVAGVGLLLARYLTTENRERSEILTLLEAQAAGDPQKMLDVLGDECRDDPRCVATVEANAGKLRRPGEPKIISLRSGTAYALGEATGVTRVAWTVIDEGLPVVQCVSVHRGGSALEGRTVTLRRISAPIGNESSC
ncbi:MAG: hypothetical protein ACJ762_14530 [Solirubrobacteraceae bacterium]